MNRNEKMMARNLVKIIVEVMKIMRSVERLNQNHRKSNHNMHLSRGEGNKATNKSKQNLN